MNTCCKVVTGHCLLDNLYHFHSGEDWYKYSHVFVHHHLKSDYIHPRSLTPTIHCELEVTTRS